MKPKVALLSSKHFCNYIKQLISFYNLKLEEECSIDFYEYDNISEISQIYISIEDKYHGFCVTGNSNKKILEEVKRDCQKPIACICTHSAEYYKEFFNLLNKNRSIDLSRVIIDSFLLFGDKVAYSVNDFISSNQRLAVLRSKLVSELTVEDLKKSEEVILSNALNLWHDKKIDYVVCSFTSPFSKLEKAGIPCSFVYPSSDTIVDTFNLLLRDIRLEQMKEDFPSVIYITTLYSKENDIVGINEKSVNLQKCILEFDQEFTTGFVINPSINGYEIYTTYNKIKNITDSFSNCNLQKYIFSHLGINIVIGYGVGHNLMNARRNALKACELSNEDNKSYLIMHNGSIIGPLDSQAVLKLDGNISDNILAASHKSKLSVSTIQRILSVTELLGTDKLTTQDLASSLNVTVANANRFLNALLKSGLAEILSEKKSYSKGRPSRIYHITFTK